MTNPKISVIMPVYNIHSYLPETIESLRNQSFKDFEVICVDDGSCDGSPELIGKVMVEDPRFSLICQKNAGAGAARNRGILNARGQYTIFLDSDDLFSPDLLEKLYLTAVETQADIVACHFSRFDQQGEEKQQEGFYAKWLPAGKTVFSYRDCPDHIMRIINPVPWNKLYRSEFIRENHLRFEEISSTNDITFASVSVAAAERIAVVPHSLVRYRVGHGGTISSGKTGKLNNVKTAVLSAVNQAMALPHGELIRNSVLSFSVGNLLYSLANYIKDFSDPVAAAFYQMTHETFNRPEYDQVCPEILHNEKQYQDFCTVRSHDYETMKYMVERRLIVSLTTYPRRIGQIPKVVESLERQSRKADEIVLWLADSQFPGKESDLPEQLRRLVSEKRLTIRWCDDLKPHKKYFYAFREYPKDLVVTVDDDLQYSPYMLQSLYASYLRYPKAVSTVRAHLIIVDEQNHILPYTRWIQETDACMHLPSMQLLATGGAGVLYPPELFCREFLDETAIRSQCLWADDLWLKAMELVSGVPVVLARSFESLRYLPNSQEEALCTRNVGENQNDVQLANIIRWTDEKYYPGILVEKLTETTDHTQIIGVEAVSQHLDKERKNTRAKLRATEYQLKQSAGELRSGNEKLRITEDKLKDVSMKYRDAEKELRQTEQKVRQTEQKVRQAEQKWHQTEQKLQRTQQRVKDLEVLASVGGQYHALGQFVKELRQSRGFSLGWCMKYVLYLLAWLPAKILIAITYLLKNGASAALKRLVQKLLRK